MRYFVSIGDSEDALVRQISFEGEGRELVVLLRRSEENFEIEHRFSIDHAELGNASNLHLLVDNMSMDFHLRTTRQGYEVQLGTELVDVKVVDERELVAESLSSGKQLRTGELRADMPGVVVSVEVAKGDEVEEGQTLLVIEAMKMQIPMTATQKGTVLEIRVEAGQTVAAGDVLVTLT